MSYPLTCLSLEGESTKERQRMINREGLVKPPGSQTKCDGNIYNIYTNEAGIPMLVKLTPKLITIYRGG